MSMKRKGWALVDRDGSIKKFGDRARMADDFRAACSRAWSALLKCLGLSAAPKGSK